MKKVVALTVILIVAVVIFIPTLMVWMIGGPTGPGLVKSKGGEDVTIRVYLHEQNQIVEMTLEDYVKGVVAAEMPAEFELEALKAQAVAARTYAVKNMTLFGGSGVAEHPGADVSTDIRQGQAWLGPAQLKNRWGPFQFDRYWNKISQAVEETRGLVVTYNGEPINAVFHSTSGERTASAKEVWGFDYPYLQSVECTWDKKSPRYNETKDYTFAELEQRLGADCGVVSAIQSGSADVARILDHTESGRVDKVRIGSKIISGIDIRQKLELRSANFSIELKPDRLVFTSIGYGHGVGMCQYGANGMAKEGRDYRQILTYYYKGVAINHIMGS
ncbi:MAG TPA: stage II sporulation protein D [Selenomonadales bacterium]|nr:stage II sporulation protein D [Selenomonadales bacterium]